MKAKWIKAEISNYYKCSNCGAYNSFPFYDKYCYECGAEMEKLYYIPKEFEESGKLKPCRHCCGQGIIFEDKDIGIYVECSACGSKTATFKTVKDAVNYWNMSTDTPYANYILELQDMIKSGKSIQEIKKSIDIFVMKNYILGMGED